MAAAGPIEVDEDLQGYMSDGPTWVEPVFEPDYSTAIVVDNLPQVPAEKVEKLLAFVKKIYVQLGSIVEGGLHMPVVVSPVSAATAASRICWRTWLMRSPGSGA